MDEQRTLDAEGALRARARLQDVLDEALTWLSPRGDNSETGGWHLAIRHVAARMEVALEEQEPRSISRSEYDAEADA